jgi:thiol-disulfide isomerase/thioredoxin
MKDFYLLTSVLVASSIFGFWYRKKQGEIRTRDRKLEISAKEIGEKLGSRLTLLQFSSAFCSPCRTTKVLLNNLTKDLPDIKHIDVDAESKLELARKLNILSTPTTIVLDADGREVGRAVGVPKRDQVLNLLEVFEI